MRNLPTSVVNQTEGYVSGRRVGKSDPIPDDEDMVF